MVCMMTLHYPYQPPIPGPLDVPNPKKPRITSYGANLFSGCWENVDPELRHIVAWCMAHDPADRPSLEYVLNDAIAHNNRRPKPGEDDTTIHNWVQNQMLSAPTLQQEEFDPMAPTFFHTT